MVEFSILSNHLHLIVEAADRRALSGGMRGLAIRVARRLNQLWGRSGAVYREGWVDPLSSAPHFAGWQRRPWTDASGGVAAKGGLVPRG